MCNIHINSKSASVRLYWQPKHTLSRVHAYVCKPCNSTTNYITSRINNVSYKWTLHITRDLRVVMLKHIAYCIATELHFMRGKSQVEITQKETWQAVSTNKQTCCVEWASPSFCTSSKRIQDSAGTALTTVHCEQCMQRLICESKRL